MRQSAAASRLAHPPLEFGIVEDLQCARGHGVHVPGRHKEPFHAVIDHLREAPDLRADARDRTGHRFKRHEAE